MSEILVRTEAVAPAMFAVNRNVAYLSDGTMVTVIVSETVDGKIEIRHTDDRATFTTGYVEASADAIDPDYLSFTVDGGDSIHLVYSKRSTKELRYRKYTWTGTLGASYTWDNSAGSTLIETLGSGWTWGRRDIEVFEDGNMLILAKLTDSSGATPIPKVRLYVRAAGVWGSHKWEYSGGATSNNDTYDSMVCSVARDTAASSGGYRKIMMAYQTTEGGSCYIQSARIAISSGAVDQVTTVQTVATDGSYTRTWGQLFSLASNVWAFVGAHGHANGTTGRKVIAYKLSYNSVLGTAFATPTTDAIGTNEYTTLGAFAFMGTDTDGYLVAFSSIVGASDATSGLRADVCRLSSNTLTWGAPFTYELNCGHEYIRSGANRNFPTRWCDVMASRVSDLKNYYIKLDTPSAPTSVIPVASSTQSTAQPTLGATFAYYQGRARAEWMTADDAGFSSHVQTHTEPESQLRAGGATTEAITLAKALTPQSATWRVKARIINEFGVYSGYSAANVFTVAHLPSAAAMTPTSGQPRATAFTFDWDFTDPYSVDYQTAYQIVVEENATGTILHDTGKITSSTTQHSITTELDAYPDTTLRWKIRLWDMDDEVGSYSAYSLFYLYAPATVTITAPDGLTDVATAAPTVTWTFSASGGRTQTKYQVIFTETDTGDIKYQTPLVLSSDVSFTPSLAILDNSTDYTITVYTVDSAGLSSSDTQAIHTSWVPPTAITFDVDATTAPGDGYVSVTWNDDDQDVDFSTYRLYRRITGETEETWVADIPDIGGSSYDYHDWTFPANISADWALVQVVIRFGSEVEGTKTWLADTGVSTDYWLINPLDETKNFQLYHVTSDSYSDEYEAETVNLIGRGRKQDRGTHYGYAGSLTISVWDISGGLTAHEQKVALETLRADNVELYLRTPFGDTFKVATGDVMIDRIAGVGIRENHTATIPYIEVQ